MRIETRARSHAATRGTGPRGSEWRKYRRVGCRRGRKCAGWIPSTMAKRAKQGLWRSADAAGSAEEREQIRVIERAFRDDLKLDEDATLTPSRLARVRWPVFFNDLTDVGCEILASGRFNVPSLSHLSIESDGGVSDKGLAALASSKTMFRRIFQLQLDLKHVGVRGVRSLCRPETAFRRVRYLDLNGCQVSATAIRDLGAAQSPFRLIQDLSLQGCGVGDAELRAIAFSPSGFRRLWRLRLGFTRVTARGVAAMIARESSLAELEELHIGGKTVDDAALAMFGSLDSSLRRLKRLCLSETGITDAGLMKALSPSSRLHSLRAIDIGGVRLSARTRSWLRVHAPHVTVY